MNIIAQETSSLTGCERHGMTEDDGHKAGIFRPERRSRSLTFYSRVLPILARYKLAELDLEQRCADEEECSAEYSELDEWGSDKLRDAILELQGFYVKSGRVLSTRVDRFPQPEQQPIHYSRRFLSALIVNEEDKFFSFSHQTKVLASDRL